MASVAFHHSNLRLPLAVERWLSRLIMTPRLHGIHHSMVVEEQDSNWSSGLTIWDRVHRTYRANVRQRDIDIGVLAYARPADVTLPRIVAMPFAHGAPWPPGGAPPRRTALGVPRTRLLP